MDALISQATSTMVGLVGSDLSLAYQPGHGLRRTIRGIFDETHETQAMGEVGVTSQGPQVFLLLDQLADASDPEEDPDAVVFVGEKAFQIHKVERDGKGGAVLRLREIECIVAA
jgi:hypothetical protein